MAASALLLGGWCVLIEPRLIDERLITARLPRLPPRWEGKRVALIADLQVGMWLANTDTVRRIVARIVQQRPAAVLIAGDLVYHALPNAGGEAHAAAALLRPLAAAGIPTYAVLGNHDYSDYNAAAPGATGSVADQVRQALSEVGVRVLDNEAVRLPSRGATASDEAASLYLVGVGAHRPYQDDPLAAIRQVPPDAARIVFMHNPESFPPLPAGSAPLALAGHTHGGQIRVPFLPKWTPAALLKPWPQYLDGWIEDYGAPGNHLYVNRGIGFSLLPIRLGAPPELTYITLHTEQAPPP